MGSGTVIDHSRELEGALKWIGEQLQHNPDQPSAALLSDAGPRFNLSPADQNSLFRLIKEARDQVKKAGSTSESL